MSLPWSSRDVFDAPSLAEQILTSPIKTLIRTLHTLCNSLRLPPIPSTSQPVSVVCISDSHNNTTSAIPDGDILIHAGDLTQTGTPSEIQAQINWLNSFPHAHKIVIAGNHDTYLDPRSRRTLSPSHRDQINPLDWGSIHYLQHSGVTLNFGPEKGNRRLRVFGAPQIPECGGPQHAFQYPRGQDAWTETVPIDTDILVTHAPPLYHRDLPISELGCEFLLREIWRVRPRLHVCGHVHPEHGREVLYWDDAQKAFERALTRRGSLISSISNLLIWVDMGLMVGYGVAGLLWERLWGGRERGATWLVNGGLEYHNTGKIGNEAEVVYL